VVLAGCRLGFDEIADPAERCANGAMFCDDFESGDLSSWPNSTISTTAQVEVATAESHSGAFAMHSQVPAIQSGASASVEFTFPIMSTGFIASREWLYLPVPLVKFDCILNVRGVQGTYATVAGDDAGRWDVTERNVSTAMTIDHHSSTAVRQNAWTCVELDYTFPTDGAPARIQLYVDDALVLDEAAADAAAAYDRVAVGVTRADAAGAESIVDDVVLSYEHIGCN
jgi:hypothetical protein